MKNKSIALLIQVFCLVSLVASIASAVPSLHSDGCQDPLLVTTSDEKKTISDASGNVTLIDENTQAKADAVAGTCPKGFHCSCPACPLYSDLDEDKFCDLGEEQDG